MKSLWSHSKNSKKKERGKLIRDTLKRNRGKLIEDGGSITLYIFKIPTNDING